MTQRVENSFIDSLCRHCRQNVPDEKVLIAPTRRIGRQWLHRVAMSGTPAVNVRIETLSSFAIRFAATELSSDGRTLLSDSIGPLVVETLIDDASQWEDSLGLAETLYKTLRDLRNACVTCEDLERAGFATSHRGARLVRMLDVYSRKLSENGYFDQAELYLRAAATVTSSGWAANGPTVLCAATEQTFWTAAQWAFWRAIPTGKRCILESCVDLQAPDAKLSEQTISMRQRFAQAVGNKRGGVEFYRALGHSAEVREVFRRCITQKIPLDEVEIIYTDKATYLPLICEECAAIFGDFNAATFIQGIPAMYSRPGRLVMEWCDWATSRFSQESFGRMLSDGLLLTANSSHVLSEKLAALPVGFGRRRWQDVVGGESSIHPDDSVLAELAAIACQQAELAIGLDAETFSPQTLISAALELVSRHSRCADAFDNLAKQRLTSFFEELLDWYGKHSVAHCTAPAAQFEWLKSSVGEMTVGALGPMSGRVHVGPIHSGGQTGRKHVFIVGMNDAFFPGRGRQDPLLLDAERQNIYGSVHKLLPLSWHMQHGSVERLIDLAAGLESRLTMSYCCHEMTDDREMYPATILLTLAAVLKNAPSFSLEELDELAGQPVAFLPGDGVQAVGAVRSVLASFGEDVRQMESVCRNTYPNMQNGFAAADAWQRDDAFTEFDGNVTPSPEDAKPKFSPSRLETLASCPRKFMFSSKLGIEPPDEISPDSETWLGPADFGTLLHNSFCEFYRHRAQRNDFDITGDETRNELIKIIEVNMEKLEREIPVPGENARRITRRQAFQAADIFLREEAIYLKERDYRPMFMEAAIGLPPEKIGDTCGTELDSSDALEIATRDGSLLIRGRIDRIDRAADGQRYVIWDYKTGGAQKFRSGKFNQGRILQHYLYSLMAGRLITSGEIESVGYYFTSYRGRGERITYKPADLRAEGDDILANLRKLVASGAYPATTDVKDCAYCDYKRICGDVKTLAVRMKRIIKNCDDNKLDAMRNLRGTEVCDDGDE